MSISLILAISQGGNMAEFNLDSFTKFTDKRKVSTHDPIITINKGGRINFNKVAFKNYCGTSRYAEFYYKPDEKIIGIKFLDNSTNESYDIKVAKNRGVGSINSYGFFKHNQIDVSASKDTETIHFDSKNAVIFLKIKE
jgi:hypothetical protein